MHAMEWNQWNKGSEMRSKVTKFEHVQMWTIWQMHAEYYTVGITPSYKLLDQVPAGKTTIQQVQP